MFRLSQSLHAAKARPPRWLQRFDTAASGASGGLTGDCTKPRSPRRMRRRRRAILGTA